MRWSYPTNHAAAFRYSRCLRHCSRPGRCAGRGRSAPLMRWPWHEARAREARIAMPFTDAVVAALAAQAAGQSVGNPHGHRRPGGRYGALRACVLPPPAPDATGGRCGALSGCDGADRPEPGSAVVRTCTRSALWAASFGLQAIGSLGCPGRAGRVGMVVSVLTASARRATSLSLCRPRRCCIAAMPWTPPGPWHGISPLGWARSTGTLAANLETRLGEEAGGPVGHVIAIPARWPGDPDGGR